MRLKNSKLVIFSIFLGIFFWIIESLVHIFVFNQEINLLKNFVFLNIHELWMRLLIISLIVILGVYSQVMVNRIKMKEQQLIEAFSQLKEEYETSNFLKNLITHDISNVLHNISMSLEMHGILNHTNSGKDLEMIQLLTNQLNRGKKLIKNIRILSNINFSNEKLKNINAIEVIKKVLEEVKPTIHSKNVKVDLLHLDSDYYIQAGDLLFNVFENIIINAIIHNQNQIKKLWIELSKIKEKDCGYVKIQFKDNGHGIPKELKKQIFAKQVKKSSKGMGIGLSLVKKIIKSYGGKIKVENRVGGDQSKGSNFIVLLKESS